MSAKQIGINNFDRALSNERTVLLDFYAEWCGPCRMVLPIIDEIAAERSDIFVGKINVGEEEELARRFGVYSIPTLIVMKDGEVLRRMTGARPKRDILKLIEA